LTDPPHGLAPSIRQLESQIDARAGGLPEELFLFVSRITPLVNVDLLIQDDDRKCTLLTWRSDRFFGPGWHVPGGIIRHKERAADRILAVALLELGAAVTFDAAPIFVHENIRASWRDRGHFISLLYRCRLVGDLDPRLQYAAGEPLVNQWLWHEKCPENLISEQRVYAAFME